MTAASFGERQPLLAGWDNLNQPIHRVVHCPPNAQKASLGISLIGSRARSCRLAAVSTVGEVGRSGWSIDVRDAAEAREDSRRLRLAGHRAA
jgi:hypothetical protein